jgi:phosphopantothenate synthetase
MTSAIGDLAQNLSEAFTPVIGETAKAISEAANAISDAFAPLLARKKPYETGRELAEIAAKENLTCAARHPVRASTEYDADTIWVSYDDGTGFERFTTYSKESLEGGSE